MEYVKLFPVVIIIIVFTHVANNIIPRLCRKAFGKLTDEEIFEIFWKSYREEIKIDENQMSDDEACIKELCQMAWEHGAFRSKTKEESIINFWEKVGSLKRENMELKAKLKAESGNGE